MKLGEIMNVEFGLKAQKTWS